MEQEITIDSQSESTLALIDAIIAIANILDGRDFFDETGAIQEAIKDIRGNDTMKRLMDIGELQSAKDYIEEQRKMIRLLTGKTS